MLAEPGRGVAEETEAARSYPVLSSVRLVVSVEHRPGRLTAEATRFRPWPRPRCRSTLLRCERRPFGARKAALRGLSRSSVRSRVWPARAAWPSLVPTVGGCGMRRKGRLAAALALAALVALGAGSVSARAGGGGAHWSVVASGLDNPRDLVWAGGKLWVAESGHGGSHCAPDGTCAGLTGKISWVNFREHESEPVVRHLGSVSDSSGTFAIGPAGVSTAEGRIYGVVSETRDTVPHGVFPAWLEAALKGTLGHLIVARPNGWSHSVADVGHHDFVWSKNHKNLVPDQFPDANPYGVFASGENTQWVVDAASNTLDLVRYGHVRVMRFIPNPPTSDAVPTCIDRGPDGAFYISQLTGAGNPPGSANVYRFAPKSGQLTIWARGLTAVTGCGFDSDGHFIAVEFSTRGLEGAAPGTGAVVRVPPHSTKPVMIVGGLNFPGGFAAGHGDTIYVSNWSIAPARSSGGSPTGQVIRITR